MGNSPTDNRGGQRKYQKAEYPTYKKGKGTRQRDANRAALYQQRVLHHQQNMTNLGLADHLPWPPPHLDAQTVHWHPNRPNTGAQAFQS